MLIGLRILLLIAIVAIGAPLLAYLFTRNRRFYDFAWRAAKIILALAAALSLIYLVERAVLVL
jgi:hypothetical protein